MIVFFRLLDLLKFNSLKKKYTYKVQIIAIILFYSKYFKDIFILFYFFRRRFLKDLKTYH